MNELQLMTMVCDNDDCCKRLGVTLILTIDALSMLA